ncbi:hypothetical protein GALL_111580 [mine drainage metagenome]|uniref:Transmembrane protein n=1 Tax=mine drainage metagenome TaxID=410659 RepID=A0A1J5SDK0_9ZZZZ
MKLTSPTDEQYEDALSPVVGKMDEQKWEKARATTLGAAGLSTAILFLITQIETWSPALWVSFFCASVAIPVWLTLWQVGEAYSFYGVASHKHFSKKEGSGVGVLLFFCGGLLLLISFITLIWHFSIAAALAFLLASGSGIVFVFKHHTAVRLAAEASTPNRAN